MFNFLEQTTYPDKPHLLNMIRYVADQSNKQTARELILIGILLGMKPADRNDPKIKKAGEQVSEMAAGVINALVAGERKPVAEFLKRAGIETGGKTSSLDSLLASIEKSYREQKFVDITRRALGLKELSPEKVTEELSRLSQEAAEHFSQ